MQERFPVANGGVGCWLVVEEFGSVYAVLGFGKVDVVCRIGQADPVADDQFLVGQFLLPATGPDGQQQGNDKPTMSLCRLGEKYALREVPKWLM